MVFHHINTTTNNKRSSLRCIWLTTLLTILIFADELSAKPTVTDNSDDTAATDKSSLTTMACASECELNRGLCYKMSNNESFQESIICLQAFQSCENDCKTEVSLRQKIKKVMEEIKVNKRIRLTKKLIRAIWN